MALHNEIDLVSRYVLANMFLNLNKINDTITNKIKYNIYDYYSIDIIFYYGYTFMGGGGVNKKQAAQCKQ